MSPLNRPPGSLSSAAGESYSTSLPASSTITLLRGFDAAPALQYRQPVVGED
jgi:hypothetical protein